MAARMNRQEAEALLRLKVEALREVSYAELVRLVGNQDVEELEGSSGVRYFVEVEAIWDDRKRGHLRVGAAIDDGGMSAFVPLTDDFIVAPDGRFIGE
jgi:hypothetical protein